MASSSSFPVRLISGVVGIVIVLAFVLGGFKLGFGVWPLAGMLAVVAGIAAWELLAMVKVPALGAGRIIGTVFAAAVPVAVALKTDDGQFVVLLAAVAVLLLWMLFDASAALEAVSVSFFAFAYVGVLLSYLVLMGQLKTHVMAPHYTPENYVAGLIFVLIAFVGTWLFDVFAYLAGSAFGRHKLAPAISPHKSWEGIAGGTIVTMAVFAVAPGSELVHGPATPLLVLWQRVALALVVAAAATLGDLVESRIKREFHTKDSGRIIPGHGGMLDRFDSLLFVAPGVYIALRLLGWS
jgi:phosphatidate cytidylyltransferase